ncbi:MAG TPA: hypothetical protein VFA21_22895 [Pyrinomonadaceae bacterium]|nr:hypothetical protein [Pyrinomonadaceae bacterium]
MPSGLIRRTLRAAPFAFVAALAPLLCACAAMTKPAGAGAPGAASGPKFATLEASDERRKAALASWKEITGQPLTTTVATTAATAVPTPELLPVTATVKSLPANLPTPPRMPLVTINDKGARKTNSDRAAKRTDEQTRESLRRFMASAEPLVGVGLGELSLVEITDAPGGARTAHYVQNSFPYPLRNGYGEVLVTFTPDLSVTALSSTAIPDAEDIRRTVAAVTQTVAADKAAASLANSTITYTDSAGNRQTRNITQADALTSRALVLFPVRRDADPQTLELHVAWEIAAGGPASPLYVYVDAATGQQIGASQTTQTASVPKS